MTVLPAIQNEKKEDKNGKKRERFRPFVLWLVPVFLFLFVFSIMPIFASIFLSFFQFRIGQPLKFIGLSNFIYAFAKDTVFITTLLNTFYYALLSVPLGMAISLVVAQFIYTRKHMQSFFRTLYFMPYITPLIAVVMVWRYFLQPSQFGIINSFLAAVHIPAQPFLNSAFQVIPSLALISIWTGLGYNMVLFLSGLGSIPGVFYEAARIDGANSWGMFWKITWPLLSPTVLFMTVTGSIGAMQVFSVPYILTNGGPEDASRTVVMWIQQTGFSQFRMGYASALAMIFFLLILVLTLAQLRWLRTRWSY
jgi:multiple sugar transport system permease protein